MKTVNIKVNENNQLVINEMVIDLFHKSEKFDHYKMEIKGRAKLIKFWKQLLQQSTTTNFGGNLNEQFSYLNINNGNGCVITFNCPKNEYKNYWSINIELEK